MMKTYEEAIEKLADLVECGALDEEDGCVPFDVYVVIVNLYDNQKSEDDVADDLKIVLDKRLK